MKGWLKKYLGWLGFLASVLITSIGLYSEFILNIKLDWSIFYSPLLIMGATSTIHDILNEKYFTKYSEKVKNRIIVFIITITIGMFLIS